MKRLEGKVAIVTGAAQGTGRVIAQSFAEQGCKLVLADVREEAGEQLFSIILPGRCTQFSIQPLIKFGDGQQKAKSKE